MGLTLNSPLSRLSSRIPTLASGPERPCLRQILRSWGVRRIVAAAACVLMLLILVRRNHKLINYYFIHNETLRYHPYAGVEEFKHYRAASHAPSASSLSGGNNWASFAYIQYADNSEYLCKSVMIFESLHRLGSLADKVMMYPEHMLDPSATEGKTKDAKLILRARDEYNVKLVPTALPHEQRAGTTWSSYGKFLAFNATQYDRVLALDPDSLVYQPMDELFLLPPCPVAMPRAYWVSTRNLLSSHLILLQPSAIESERIAETISDANKDDIDTEIFNELYGDSAMVLPHQRYALATSEFRREDHKGYLGSAREVWDPVAAFNEAKFVHFSDWPAANPRLPMPGEILAEKEPRCYGDGIEADCSDRDIWKGIYSDFRSLKERVCESGLH